VRPWKSVVIVVCVAALGAAVIFVRDFLAGKRALAERTACVGTLTRLRLTKAMYAQDHGLTNGAVIPDEVVWRDNGVVEHCHSGGRYSIKPLELIRRGPIEQSFEGANAFGNALWQNEDLGYQSVETNHRPARPNGGG
jgi:hypothetical protein